MIVPISSSLKPFNPSNLLDSGYTIDDQNLIPSLTYNEAFFQGRDRVEFFVYDANKTLISSNYNFTDWTVEDTTPTVEYGGIDNMELDPVKDVYNQGFYKGKLYALYNFIRPELKSSLQNAYYISDISSDRTEIRIKSNFIDNAAIKTSYTEFKRRMVTSAPEETTPDRVATSNGSVNFNDFNLSFGGNETFIGVNLLLEEDSRQNSLLVKLYQPLPSKFGLKNELYIYSKRSDTKSFEVDFIGSTELIDDVKYLQGPNLNLEMGDSVNNSTIFKSKDDLLDSNSTGSRQKLQNILNQKGVKITPNYSYNTFNEFVHFSSAKSRIENFILKVKEIESYNSDINTLLTITGSTSSSIQVSSSIESLNGSITEVIENFDGYEYFLYDSASIFSYPKTGSSYPYNLLDSTDTEVLTWLGSDVEDSQYYGGIILSASRFDNNNMNWLYYTIPDFIKENGDNESYIQFCSMVGQHFDDLWLYIKTITQKLNTTNVLDKGIPLKLANDVIESFGFKGLGNNYNNQDNYISLLGENDGVYVPATGSEFIDNYIAINNGGIVNYWDPDYSYLFYVEQLLSPGFPYALDDVSKEIYKRLYHNMASLVKKKGTVSGLRQLINIWGVPNTILKINEFGGKNRDNINDYDLWENRYSYAYSPIANQNAASSSVKFPWKHLERNRIAGESMSPDTIMFRFKSEGIPNDNLGTLATSQSLLACNNDGDSDANMGWALTLYYTGSISGSYSGSSINDYNDYGLLKFTLGNSSSTPIESPPIYLPFFDKGWWSVMLKRSNHTSSNAESQSYDLYVKNSIHNGFDGNGIGFAGSTSLDSQHITNNSAFSQTGSGDSQGLYLGGYISGSQVGDKILTPPNQYFSGSFQEFRYYSSPMNEFIFNDYVMNPRSIEGDNITGSLSSFDVLNFRAPLGNELESIFTSSMSSSHTESLVSMHPAVTGSVPTQSFYDADTTGSHSNFEVLYYDNTTTRTFSKINREVVFMDQPSIGIRNRISNKIQIGNDDAYGNILSPLNSIQQYYDISSSYTEDINSLEVAFSPQNEINDDIINSIGFGKISNILGDPRLLKGNTDHYSELRYAAEEHFKKYTKGNIYDYLRVIKYFDNSLFKAIKNYVPARTSVTTGIVIKQHLLERNKYPTPVVNHNTRWATTPEEDWNTPLIQQNLVVSTSISNSVIFSGGTGGSVGKFNYNGTASFHQLPITQSWIDYRTTTSGTQAVTESSQKEFYDGEYSGSTIKVIVEDVQYQNPVRTFKPSKAEYDMTFKYTGTSNYNPYSASTIQINNWNLDNYGKLQNAMENYVLSESVGAVVYTIDVSDTLKRIGGIILVENDRRDGRYIDIIEKTTDFYPSGTYGYGGVDKFPRPPYFNLKLPNLDTGSFLAGADPKTGYLGWDTINSAGLGYFGTGLLNQPHSSSGQTGWLKARWFLFDISNDSNPRGISGSSGFGWDSASLETVSGSEFNYMLNNYPDVFSITSGTVLTTLQAVSWNETSSFSEWYPQTVVFHNTDLNGNYHKTTLQGQPDWEVNCENTLGYASWTDTYSLPSTKIKTNHLNLIGYADYSSEKEIQAFHYDGNDRHNSRITSSFSLEFPFNPFIPVNVVFTNSDYDVLINNYNDNVLSNYIQKVDYTLDGQIPVNLDVIKSHTATKAQVPDSNYTSLKHINPRYDGCKIYSLDYNNYTPPGDVQNKITLFTTQSNTNNVAFEFLNGDTGSWGGDKSYGNAAVVDKNPIYMGHFNTSNENYTQWGTHEFELDQLVFVPSYDILGEKGYEPQTLKIDGGIENLQEVNSTFEVKRKVNIRYTNRTTQRTSFANSQENLNIVESAMEFIPLSSNELSETSASVSWSYSRFEDDKVIGENESDTILLTTGSGYLNLSGSDSGIIKFAKAQNYTFEAYDNTYGWIGLQGPYLAVLHTYNQALANLHLYTSGSDNQFPTEDGGALNVVVSPGISSTNPTSYFKWDASGSLLPEYEDFQEPFLLKRGDEIRVSYQTSGSVTYAPVPHIQDFTITRVFGRYVKDTDPDNYYRWISNQMSHAPGTTDLKWMFDRIEVTPDPSTLRIPIPKGEILAYTIRRRKENDSKIIIKTSPPSGSAGVQQKSGGGFLLPQDLSPTQKRNALNIINQLQAKNAFRDDDSLRQ